MTALQVEVWLTERQFEYRSFGLAAALLESVPILGMAFSISNRVGAAMYAHDLEKRQQMVRAGQIKRLPRSETHSSKPKIGFSENDEGINVPGGVPSSSSASRLPSTSIPDDAPPAYSIAEAETLIGGSGGPGGDLGVASPHESAQGLSKRKTAPPPVPPRK